MKDGVPQADGSIKPEPLMDVDHVGRTVAYMASLPPDAKLLNRVVRSHWGVENRLHWVLDLAFHEDGQAWSGSM